MTQPSIVEVEAVSKRFISAEGAQLAALDGVTLSIHAGRFTTLLGPSGCGKTTLLRVIGGFEAPDEGLVRIDGADVTHLPPYARPVNTVFQHYALFPHLTVAENVAYGLEVARAPKREIAAKVERALALVRLEGLGGRRTTQISGGQQQRVALARSLVLEPKVLLLDEPLAALDRKLRKDMQFELKRLQNEIGIAFLCVTHDQEEALSMSDTVVVMNQGRIEQIGSPREVYDRPATRFVAGFVGEASMLPCRPAGPQNPEQGPGTTLALKDGETIVTAMTELPQGDLIAIIRPERLALAGLVSPGRPTLRGVARQHIYLGDQTRLEVGAGGGTVQVLLDGAIEPPAEGAAVELAYDPAHVRVVAQ